jgi:hypothetical protein
MPNKKKHPKDMTNREALKALFPHPEARKHIKEHVVKLGKPSSTKKG